MKNKFTLIALAVVWSLALWGDSTSIDGKTWYYKQNNDGQTTATITGGPNSGAITVPERVSSFAVTRIGSAAFRNCSGLTSVDLPNSLHTIESEAFFNCQNLATVVVPAGLKSIGDYAFNFTAVKTFRISAALESIGANPFWPSQLATFEVDADCVNYKYSGGVLYDKRTSAAVLCPPATTRTSIEIASGTVTISDAAFGGCGGIVEITIPSSVTKIKSGAFNACTSLKTVHVSDGDASRVKNMLSVSGLDVSGIVFDPPETPTVPVEPKPDGGPYAETVDGIAWTFCVSDGVVEIRSDNDREPAIPEETVGKITIPMTLGGRQVTSIGSYAFNECSRLTSVTIPEGVTSIGDLAFSDCSGLLSVALPTTLLSIGEHAFSGCSALTSATLPPSVISIGDFAFGDCPGLQDEDGFVIRNGILFGYYGSLTTVEVPEGVTSIGGYAFSDNTEITSVTMPSGVASIGWAAFSGCSKLASVAMPSSLTSIDGYAFNNCTGINSITIPSEVTILGYGAFMGCTGLETLAIPPSVTSVGYYAFYNCTELASITVPSSVANIGSNAFLGCGKLTTVYVDKGDADRVRVMVSGTGFTTDGLTFTEAAYKVDFQLDEEELFETKYVRWGDAIGQLPIPSRAGYEFTGWFTDAVEGVKIDESYIPTSDTTVYARWMVISQPDGGPYEQEVDGVVWKYTVSNGAASIGWGTRTTETAVPGTTVGAITIPSSLGNCPVTRIWEHAFYGCGGITALTIPEGVTSIGAYAFAYCSGLISVTIPSSATSIADYAFDGSEALKEIKVSADNMNYHSYDGVLYDKDCTTLITCPKGKDSVTIIDGVSCIAARAFRSCKTLISVELPDSVREIRGSAFKGCTALTTITIPSGVGEIGESAFENCSSLASIDIPPSVIKIDYAAFGSCENLAEVKFHEGLEIIGGSFFGCKKLSSFTIPTTVRFVTDGSFWDTKRYQDCCASETDYIIMDNCLFGLTTSAQNNLKDIVVPQGVRVIASSAFGSGNFETATLSDTVRVIGDSAFASSTIKSITIPPNSVKTIGSGAFRRSELVDVNIPEGVESIGDEAFYECKNLKTVTIAGTVKSIGASCFAYSRYVQSLSMGEGVEKIGESAFLEMGYQWVYWNIGNSVKIDIPSTIKEIGANAFSRTGYKNVAVNLADVATWCEAKFSNSDSVPWYYRYGGTVDHLKYPDLKIPYGPTKITSYAFAYWKCSGLIELPQSVRRIESNAFYNGKMISIKIPSSVTEIEKGAFDYCSNLKTIYVSENDTARVKEMMRGMMNIVNGKSVEMDVDDWEFIEVSAVEFSTAESVAEVFGDGSAMAECVKDPTQLAAFNTFLSDCGITSVESITAAQKQYAYQSFKLAEITTAPQLFDEEPVLKIDDIELSSGNLSLTISLTAGAEAIQLAKDKLAEKIRVGSEVSAITQKPVIGSSETADNQSVVFTIVPPQGNKGFIRIIVE